MGNYRQQLVVFVVASVACLVSAQFPRVCIHNVTTESGDTDSGICCPAPPESNLPCGGPLHGHCVMIEDVAEDHPASVERDDRYRWPLQFFHHHCKCSGNYAGYDCAECKFGYSGSRCQRKTTNVRRNIHAISKQELTDFKQALLKAKRTQSDYVVLNTSYQDAGHPHFKDVSNYDYFTYVHYYAARDPVTLRDGKVPGDVGYEHPLDYAHEGPSFIPWHRKFMLGFERMLQKVAGKPQLTVPYWDWTGDGRECTVCTNEYLGANENDGSISKGSEFSDWATICANYSTTLRPAGKICDVEVNSGGLRRLPSQQPGLRFLPTYDETAFCYQLHVYDVAPYDATSHLPSYRNYLEGFLNMKDKLLSVKSASMHAKVHIYFTVVMNEVPVSANDPIFFVHHSNVDRLHEAWLRKIGSMAEYPEKGANVGHNKGSYIVPNFPLETNGDYLSTSWNLGYTYDSMAISPDLESKAKAKNDRSNNEAASSNAANPGGAASSGAANPGGAASSDAANPGGAVIGAAQPKSVAVESGPLLLQAVEASSSSAGGAGKTAVVTLCTIAMLSFVALMVVMARRVRAGDARMKLYTGYQPIDIDSSYRA
ncbi:PREDICTED: tyrosinase-like [Priapulus caudatus]|uniref:Tyrosinase-like n=1 Tax=Priapulus caudatus TaxID=37621 RepID=A0ABM1EQT0_PRICU|nr:PREDICTED: tyrosinase-like [Priapulus caudatus]